MSEKIKKIISNKKLEGKSLSQIADEQGIEVFSLAMDELSNVVGFTLYGIIRKTEGSYKIYVDNSLTKENRRFIFACGLGHYFVHKKELDEKGFLYNQYGSSLSDPYQKRSMEFARELLMPEDLFKEYASISNDVEVLASFLKVSRGEVALRLEQFGF